MATIKDIADRAGVSPSTASRALNDNPRISSATRERVQAIARQLGYHPNYTAQTLTRGEANMVGLIFPVTGVRQPANPFHLELMRGVGQALATRNYTMVVAMAESQGQLLATVKSMVHQSKVHRFLLFYTQEGDPVTAYLRQRHLNFVVIGHPERQHHDRFVDNDNIQAGYAAARLLRDRDQVTQVAFISSGAHWQYERDRQLGAQQLAAEANLPETSWALDQGSLAAFLGTLPARAGLIFADDLLYLRVARELTLSAAPFALVCFNNSRLLNELMPEINQIDLKPRALGQAAVALLFDPQRQHCFVPFKI